MAAVERKDSRENEGFVRCPEEYPQGGRSERNGFYLTDRERKEVTAMSVRIEVWGENACFTRPEMKAERVSYDIITPSAARGILESVYWHPGMQWHIDKIHVLSPIRFSKIRRNEVKSKIKAASVLSAINGSGKELWLATSEEIQQRASMILTDVHYVVEAHFTMTEKAAPGDNAGKFQSIVKRRLEKGQCYSQPYLGTREFPARFRLYEPSSIPVEPTLMGEKDLGYMLYDMDYSDPQNITPLFFRAVLHNGTLDLTDCEVLR